MYNKRATGQRKAMERDSGCPRALDNGPRCRYLEELTHGRHMQQEQCTQKNAAAAAAATVGRFPQQR
jgi:hypothetical protein